MTLLQRCCSWMDGSCLRWFVILDVIYMLKILAWQGAGHLLECQTNDHVYRSIIAQGYVRFHDLWHLKVMLWYQPLCCGHGGIVSCV